ncbi:hypothetical protein [Roseibium sp.]|uniref:hypothetical protein n=1 Tax=Roseibium sp. TaxID=1936156 RepID=UPI003B52429F
MKFEVIKITHQDSALVADGKQIAVLKHISDPKAVEELIRRSEAPKQGAGA